MPINVQYMSAGQFAASAAATPLCVIGYGAPRPSSLAEGCPFVRLKIPALGEPCYEVWSVEASVAYDSSGEFMLARSPAVLLGMTTADEEADWPLEELARHVYTDLLDMVEDAGMRILRLWNYLPHITGPDSKATGTHRGSSLERYRRFNVGRHEAFIRHHGQITSPPAASALGSAGRPTAIFMLAGLAAGRPVENPRQVSAYNYPAQYGPRSPTFSRATVAEIEGRSVLFISGTASIVGHASVHPGNLAAQTRETLVNLRTVLGEAAKDGFDADPARLKLKVYLRRPGDLAEAQALIEAEFAGAPPPLYVQADVCRSELLVEIEAMCPGR